MDARWKSLALAVAACGALAAVGGTRANWNVGPLFQYRRAGAEEFWAVRPFWSHVSDPAHDAAVHDVLWPLGTGHAHGGGVWWRALNAFGATRGADDPSWSFTVFPLCFGGRDRAADAYWGVFPIYGRHPHLLTMDDWRFALWPFWHTYTVKDVRSHAVLWPLFTWRDAPRAGAGLWPLFGIGSQRESRHAYLLWPVMTWATYAEDRDTSGAGGSWMVWPLYGQVRRARESQTLVLPPFFSHARTDETTRWRLPWPFVEILRSPVRDRTSVWPFYESVAGYSYADKARRVKTEERTRRYLWYLVEDTELETDRTLETRVTFFPFWTREKRYVKAADGTRTETASYTRVWPFWSRSTENGLARQRVLELNPIRHADGLDRNWSPFWTFWECYDKPDGRTRHSLFWHLVTWHW